MVSIFNNGLQALIKITYLYGSLSKRYLPKYSYGSVRKEIYGSGHFGHYENFFEFNKIFNKLIIK